jgi:hypothetical protein
MSTSALEVVANERVYDDADGDPIANGTSNLEQEAAAFETISISGQSNCETDCAYTTTSGTGSKSPLTSLTASNLVENSKIREGTTPASEITSTKSSMELIERLKVK